MSHTEQNIETKIRRNFQPQHMQLINESHMHAGPATDSHFKLVIVSDLFENMPRVRRHQAVYKVLAQELAGEVHALALHTHSPAEWAAVAGKVQASPECAGKNK